jgi:hypothetical protein
LICFLFLATVTLPTFLLLNYFGLTDIYLSIPYYAWVIYLLIFNSLVLYILLKFLIRTIPFPFSSQIFSSGVQRAANRKFSLEFRNCVERMTLMIKDMTER